MEQCCLPFLLRAVASAMLITGPIAARDQDWNDTVVAKEDAPTTLPCSDQPLKHMVKVNWLWTPHGQDSGRLILSADQRQQFLGGGKKTDVRLADMNFQVSGNFSLFFRPRAGDGGLYSCLIKQDQRNLSERIILLLILTISIGPPLPAPEHSTLRLLATVSPLDGVSEVAWLSPLGVTLRSEALPTGGVVAKLPHITRMDEGDYTCRIRTRRNNRKRIFQFNYPVTVESSRAAKFLNITYIQQQSKACLAHSTLLIPCASVRGDYVLLYWQHPDSDGMEQVFSFDRWRQRYRNQTKPRLRLADPISSQSGTFSFLLTPQPKEGGIYLCEVFLDDNVFSQSSRVSVLHVFSKSKPSAMVLWCVYNERSQVEKASWTHQNLSRRLNWSSNSPGRISTEVLLPATLETAGNYTCTLYLKNRTQLRAVYVVALPRDEHVWSYPASLYSSLYVLGLLVPLVAVAVSVFLWKRRPHNACPGIENSLSHYTGDMDNIYENPEDLRQSSVYMDLKPSGENDIYEELDRFEQCQS